MDTILNWIWQGSIVALVTSAVLGLARGLGGSARYRLCSTAYLIVLLIPIVPPVLSAPEAALVVVESQGSSFYAAAVAGAGFANVTSILVAVWAAWVAVMGSRLAVAFVSVRQAVARSVVLAETHERRLANWMAVRGSGRTARLVVSDRVRCAAVIGCAPPVIALAPALVANLEDEELDRVVIHEWSHVQRYDDVAHFAQLIVRVLVGWHPAIWWIGRQLHHEREAACDQMAVRVTGSPKTYAACLAKLADLPLPSAARLAAPRALSSSDVGNRIIRVLRSGENMSVSSSRIAAFSAASVLGVIGVLVASIDLVVTASPATTPSSVPGITQDHQNPPASRRREPVRIETRASTRRVDEAPAIHVPVLQVAERMADLPGRVPATAASSTASAERELLAPSIPAQELSAASPELPADSLTPPPVVQSAIAPLRSSAPWTAAADAGTAIGRGSQKAAVATAGFFNRLGRNIGRSF